MTPTHSRAQNAPSLSYEQLPRTQVTVEAKSLLGPWEPWRHTIGQGGINPLPMPPNVVRRLHRSVKPRLLRIFLQEFFRIYPEHGRFDWTRLDPYMDSLAQTEAHLVAAITIKPPPLFPEINQDQWMPTDVAEWQQVIRALVRRYSVEKQIVTHWEIGNETDIGESGGTPFRIPDPEDYTAFYRMTIAPVLEEFPDARVGGPAACWIDNEPLPGFVDRCRHERLPLHFISWHHYGDNPDRHAEGVRKARSLIADWPGTPPELMVTEWSKGFDPVSVEELAYDPRRSATIAACLLGMVEAGLDWSFYYHLWDQVCNPADFQPFFSPQGVDGMLRHWNEVPHRFGLFGVGNPLRTAESRPYYDLFCWLAELGQQRIGAHAADSAIRLLAAQDEAGVRALVVNWSPDRSEDRLLDLCFTGLEPGRRYLAIRQLRNARGAGPRPERREVYVSGDFRCQAFCPANGVLLISLETPRILSPRPRFDGLHSVGPAGASRLRTG